MSEDLERAASDVKDLVEAWLAGPIRSSPLWSERVAAIDPSVRPYAELAAQLAFGLGVAILAGSAAAGHPDAHGLSRVQALGAIDFAVSVVEGLRG